MVIETCELAQAMLNWKKETNCGKTEGLDLSKLKFTTNDPAPPFNYKDYPEKYGKVEQLKAILLDPKEVDFDRNRALFTLRELYTTESCLAICQTLTKENFENCGALLKHEVAFILA
jgi:hypothetical protein